ncbi:MAG: hypothetical protein V3U90_03540 [Dehalococcoidia bacterium]
MSRKALTGSLLFLFVLATGLVVNACGGGGEEPTPIPTSALIPTPTPTSTVDFGAVKGKLIGADSQRPLSGAAIILCLFTDERECTLQASLIATADESGEFQLSDVPPGSYVVLYDPSGGAKAGWEEIDGLKIKYGFTDVGLGGVTREFIDSFGGGSITIQEGTGWTYSDGELVAMDGSYVSEKYGLTMDFHMEEPVTIEARRGETTEFELRAWAQ